MKFMCALVLQKGRFFANKQDDTWAGAKYPGLFYPFHPYAIVNDLWGYLRFCSACAGVRPAPTVVATPYRLSMSA